MKNDEFSRAAWVRGVVLRRPSIDLEQLQEEYDRGGTRPKDKRPTEIQVIYQARTELIRRWGVASVEDLQRRDGKLIMAAMIRLYLTKFGTEKTHSDAIAYFEADSLPLASGVFSNQKSIFVAKEAEAADKLKMTDEPNVSLPGDDDSPDTNQDAGPRARKVSRKGRRPGAKNKPRQTKTTPTSNIGLVLINLKKCVNEAGGFAETREALKVLEQLQSIPS